MCWWLLIVNVLLFKYVLLGSIDSLCEDFVEGGFVDLFECYELDVCIVGVFEVLCI